MAPCNNVCTDRVLHVSVLSKSLDATGAVAGASPVTSGPLIEVQLLYNRSKPNLFDVQYGVLHH